MLKRVRTGFTLVELLVVVAIILILLAMILPAVQKVREIANRLECTNHLRTMGQGIRLHLINHGNYFPTGGGDNGKSPVPPHYPTPPRGLMSTGAPISGLAQDWGWMYQILPYIEHENLWKSKNLPFVDPHGIFHLIDREGDLTVATTLIPTYFCPSRREPGIVNHPEIGPRAANDYAGNMGAFTPIFETGVPHDP